MAAHRSARSTELLTVQQQLPCLSEFFTLFALALFPRPWLIGLRT